MAGEKVVKHEDWPANPRTRSGQLRRLAPDLRSIGVEVSFAPKTGQRRQISITRAESTGERPSSASPPSPGAASYRALGDGDDGPARTHSSPATDGSPDHEPPAQRRWLAGGGHAALLGLRRLAGPGTASLTGRGAPLPRRELVTLRAYVETGSHKALRHTGWGSASRPAASASRSSSGASTPATPLRPSGDCGRTWRPRIGCLGRGGVEFTTGEF